uniref:MutL C-terminal dimerisation domain-containing protein n=1 Tax=Globisporangium ultimum (strain ATCC 200006 / CBS 805.95 / DAOM BR144) TaxID=431595 RepID=K3WIM5_GLOUD
MSALETIPKATGGTLHVLDKRDVQRICSGQSVVDLATAVKEMVENALDAGATLVEVKLREFGKESIEVSDNGSGIAPANYETVALKHYTSKISRFEDIETVASFGFRGEALSSICQLVSSFSVCTRTKDAPIGAFLEFDSTGKLTKQTQKARPVGTTIMIEELFKPLAVRHKDFHRNIKKHYAKLLKILQAYAVSSTNVKISVVNVTGKHATRQVVLATQAHQSLGDNIASVFGTKFARTLLSVNIDLSEVCQELSRKPAKTMAKSRRGRSGSDDENEDGKEERESDDDDEDDEMCASQLEKTRQVVGYVSKVGAGVGRSDNDRQFFFINGRPFDLPKMAKALNEVWRQYEMKQKPACVLNFLLPLGDYDVNVTPDKRETFIKHEAEIIQAFKTQLNKLYEPSRGTFLVQPVLSSFTRDCADVHSDKSSIKKDLEPTKWSFSEMLAQRKQFFKEEVEDEIQRRQKTRLKVPQACSASSENSVEEDNDVAAAALQRVLKKDDFKRMQVLGQFNLGFIIGKLDDDLFIIDQHASDEKFNYETLQQTTVLHQQPLVRPLPLELTAGEEMVILDHLDVFAKNGFTFLVQKDAPATKKLKLLSLPFTKHTQFGVEDIRELASLLMDTPTNAASIRLPKVMAMFASRACRSSIMIGTALHKDEMQKIVRNLSGLEQPWNCPHGYDFSAFRPTLRHLMDLRQLEENN